MYSGPRLWAEVLSSYRCGKPGGAEGQLMGRQGLPLPLALRLVASALPRPHTPQRRSPATCAQHRRQQARNALVPAALESLRQLALPPASRWAIIVPAPNLLVSNQEYRQKAAGLRARRRRHCQRPHPALVRLPRQKRNMMPGTGRHLPLGTRLFAHACAVGVKLGADCPVRG